MGTHVALLKGINVGGRNLVKMAELKALFLELGFESCQTLLQSGNVVFNSEKWCSSELESLIQAAFQVQFNFNSEFHVRDADEWHKIIVQNPFPREAKEDPSHLVVHFLRTSPEREVVATTQSLIKGPEQILPGTRHFYISYPDGIGNSAVAKTPGWNKLMSNGTARNWNTVLKLASML